MKSSKKKQADVSPPAAKASVSRRSFLNILWSALGLAAAAEFFCLTFSFLRPSEDRRGDTQASMAVPAGLLSLHEPGTVTAFQRGEFYLVRLQDGHVGQVAVLVPVIETIADHESVGNLEGHVIRP